MKLTGILFAAPMVQAIRSGRKTQTRRIIKPQPVPVSELRDEDEDGPRQYFIENGELRTPARYGSHAVASPYGKAGDQLWGRESFWQLRGIQEDESGEREGYWRRYAEYDDQRTEAGWRNGNQYAGWMARRPSIHMPRWASRLNLTLTSVRIERLQDISEEDAIAEGIEPVVTMGAYRTFANYRPGGASHLLPIDSFRSLWESINGPDSWKANPWVWVLEWPRFQETPANA